MIHCVSADDMDPTAVHKHKSTLSKTCSSDMLVGCIPRGLHGKISGVMTQVV